MAINLTEKQIEILFNGSSKATYDQRANSSQYDVSASASAETVYGIAVMGYSGDSYNSSVSYEVRDGNGDTLTSGVIEQGQVKVHTYTNVTPTLNAKDTGTVGSSVIVHDNPFTVTSPTSLSFNGVSQS